jgi:hypothetical protein
MLQELRKASLLAGILVLCAAVTASGLTACSKKTPTPTTPSGPITGTLVQTDSILTGQIKAIQSMATGYPWEVDVLVQSTQDVGDLRNPISDKVGQVVQFRTDQDMNAFKVGQTISGRAKLTGDVEVGTTLYLYDVK